MGVLDIIPDVRATKQYTPRDVSGLEQWYDASFAANNLYKDTARTDPVTANGDGAKGVVDLSGNGRHLSEATNPPIYTTGAQGGRSTLRFDGIAQVLSGARASGRTSRSLFFVGRKQTPGSALNYNMIGWGSGGGVSLLLRSNSTGTAWAFYATEAFGRVSFGGTINNFDDIGLIVASTTSAQAYRTGAVVGSAFDPADNDWNNNTTLTFGGLVGTFGDLELGEFASYDHNVSDLEMAGLSTYAKAKWGY